MGPEPVPGDDPPEKDGSPVVDARGARGVQAGFFNFQVNFYGEQTWGGQSAHALEGSPYRGLSAFEAADAELFFGRGEATGQVLGRLAACARGPGLVMVSGVSGAGKSSLLRAGVLPRLRRDGLAGTPGAASWPCLLLTPGPGPLEELAVQAATLAGTDSGMAARALADHPDGFALTARQVALVRHAGPPGSEPGRLLLVVDQFEQLFTACPDEGQRRAFITALHAAATTAVGPTRAPAALVVLGVRADFESRCADYPELAAAVQDRYLLTAMTSTQLRLAITGPAERAGATVDAGLTELLLHEIIARPGGLAESRGAAEAGVLPLLSHALDETWRTRDSNNLTLADYERTGGIKAAVARSAQDAYGGLSAAQQAAARQVFLRLVATGPGGTDTAVPASTAALTASVPEATPGDVDAVLDAFARQRLLVLADGTVEIAHEVLLTAWPLLRDNWLGENRADRVILSGLRTTASDWARHGEDSAYLYTGSLLEAATAAAARADGAPGRHQAVIPGERAFLTASSRARRRRSRRLRALLTVLTALSLALATATVVAFVQRTSADTARDQAIQNQIVSEAELLSATDPSLAAQLLLTARNRDPQSQDLAWRLISTEGQTLTTSENSGIGSLILSVAFSPDGMTLAAGGLADAGVGEGGVTLWSVNTPSGVRQIGRFLVGNSVESVAFSPNGTTLAVNNYDGTVTLWDVSDPARPRRLSQPLPSHALFPVAFSPNGTTLATGNSEGTVTLWDVTNPAHPSKLGQPLTPGNDDAVESVAFSPNGATLAAGNSDGTVTLWDVTNPAHPSKLGQPLTPSSDNAVESVAFSPSSTTLAIDSGMVTLWDVSNPAHPSKLGQPLTPGNDDAVESVAFSPNGTTLAGGGGGEVTLWNVGNPAAPSQVLTTSDDSAASAVAFSPDGTTLAAADTGDAAGAVTLWSPPSIDLAATTDDDNTAVNSVAFGPNGTTLATGDNSGAVTLWDVSNPARPSQLGQPFTTSNYVYVDSVAFSPNGKTLAASDTDDTEAGAVTLWDVSNPVHPSQLGRPLSVGTLGGPVAFSPNGTTLAGADGGDVTLWDVSDPAHPRELGQPLPSDGVFSVAFSPGGSTLAIGDDALRSDGTVTLWDVSDPAHPRKLSQPLATGSESPVDSVAFSPNGTTLAIGGGAVTLWDVADPAHPRELGQSLTTSDGNPVDSVAFSPDGTTLAAGGSGGAVTLWDVSNPAQPSQLGGSLATGSDNLVNSVAFSPDGGTLAAGDDGTQLWNRDVSYAIRRVCELTAGELTAQQWTQFNLPPPYDPPCSS